MNSLHQQTFGLQEYIQAQVFIGIVNCQSKGQATYVDEGILHASYIWLHLPTKEAIPPTLVHDRYLFDNPLGQTPSLESHTILA